MMYMVFLVHTCVILQSGARVVQKQTAAVSPPESLFNDQQCDQAGADSHTDTKTDHCAPTEPAHRFLPVKSP